MSDLLELVIGFYVFVKMFRFLESQVKITFISSSIAIGTIIAFISIVVSIVKVIISIQIGGV